MAYEIYKKELSMEGYFSHWAKDQVDSLTDELKDRIYNKHLVKKAIFQRDEFKCQNENCTGEDIRLDLHHIKFQKNGGQDKVRNGVTICKTCHKNFHNARDCIKYYNRKELPSHIRGQTFRLHISDEIDWKKVRCEMKKLRKTLKTEHGINISWERFSMLLQWLELDYEYN